MNFLRKLFAPKAPAPAPASPAHPGPAAATPSPVAPPASAPPPLTAASPDASSASSSQDSTFRFQSVPAPAAAPVPIETTLLAIPCPLWLPPDSPAVELCPMKSEHAPLVAFLGGSAEFGEFEPSEREAAALAAGRLARVLPFYLAEQVEFGADALACVLLSWIVKPTPGFILGGKNWDDATAARHARQSIPDSPADYLVVTHVVCRRERWAVELRLVRTIDASCLATATARFPATDPGAALAGLARDLLTLLAAHAEVSAPTPDSPAALLVTPDVLPVPGPAYLLALDQLLAVLTAGLGPVAGRLSTEREIIESQLRLCREQPDNLALRLLCAQTLRALKKVRPAVLPEFQARADELQLAHPLSESAQAAVGQVLAEAFAA